MTRGENLGNGETFGERFGALVLRKRTQQGLSLAQLASRLFPRADPTGERRAPDVQKFESGKTKKPRARTVRLYQNALHIAQEEIDALVDDADRPQWLLTQQLIEQKSALAQKLSVSTDLAVEIAERYAEGNPDNLDAALRGLERALRVAAEESAKDALPANTDAAVDVVLKKIDELNNEGRVDEAAVLIAEQEAQAQAGLVRLYDRGIAQSILTRDVKAAADYELKKLSLELPEPDRAFDYLKGVFTDWLTRGRDRGLNFDTEVAIFLMRQMVRRFEYDQEKKGFCLTSLGTALAILGQREIGTDRLDEAISAYRAALAERARDRVPFEWAITQMNLGSVLKVVGDREQGTDRLREAVAAFRSVLQEWTRDRDPLDWAMTQMNLGNTLRVLGEREQSSVFLEEAVSAHCAALLERTRDRVPLDWAKTQMNLGNALKALGVLQNDLSCLEKAVNAYKHALKEQSQGSMPVAWATTQFNLGSALAELAERQKDAANLTEAIIAYDAALEEQPRDQTPLEWAYTMGNKARALMTLADWTNDQDMANRAQAQLTEARMVLVEGGHQGWADELTRQLS